MATQNNAVTELLEQGMVAKRNGDYQQAISYDMKAMESSPTDRRAYMNLFKIYCGLGQYDRALFYITIASNFFIIDQTYKQDANWRTVVELNMNGFSGNYTLHDDQQNKTLKIGQQLIQQMVRKNEALNSQLDKLIHLRLHFCVPSVGLIAVQFSEFYSVGHRGGYNFR